MEKETTPSKVIHIHGREGFIRKTIIENLSKEVHASSIHVVKEDTWQRQEDFYQFKLRFSQKRSVLNGYTYDKFIQEKDRVLAKESKLSANDRKEIIDCWEYITKEKS